MTVIKKLEITSFGKFRDFTLELGGGLNEICRENEFGKSTITDFILFALYGFTHSNARNVTPENNLLMKYLPWNGEPVISGALELEADGRFLRVERTQNKGRKSMVALRDASGAELPLSGEPGQALFGVDKETFLRTFLIRQTDVKFSDCDALAGALSNLVTTGNEETSYSAAMKILSAKRGKFISRAKQTGRVYDLKKQLTALELEEADQRARLNGADDPAAEREELRAALRDIEEERAAAEKELPLARGGDAKRTLERINALRSERETLTDGGGELPDADRLADMTRAFTDRDRAVKVSDGAAARLSDASAAERKALDDCPDYDEIRANEAEYARIAAMKDGVNIPLIAAGCALVAVGVALAFINPLLGLIAAAGALLAALGFIIKKKAPGGFGKSREELMKAYDGYRRSGSAVAAARAERESAGKALEAAQAERETAERECAGYTEEYGVTDVLSVTRLAALSAEKSHAAQRRAQIEAELAALPDAAELEKFAAIGESELTEKEVQDRIIALNARRERAAERLAELEKRCAEREETARRLYETDAALTETKAELAYAERRAKALSLAEDSLERAYESISNRFSPIVNSAASAPLSALTDGRYADVTLGRDFTIRVKADGEYRELGYFSRGTADAVYFAYRFAMCDLVSDKKGLPLILDDPFWSLDGTRLKNARAIMEKAGESRQIILFSARY